MKRLFLFTIIIILFSSCAEVQNNLQPCLKGDVFGFWGGLWHGSIAGITFIISLFRDDITVWAVNNNGGWYTFRFLLGVGGFTTGCSKCSK